MNESTFISLLKIDEIVLQQENREQELTISLYIENTGLFAVKNIKFSVTPETTLKAKERQQLLQIFAILF